MLRTNTKKVSERVQAHIINNFEEDHETREEQLKAFKSQIDYMRYPRETIYQTCKHYAEGGSLLCYYNDVRDFLKEVLEETEEENEKYDNEKVWTLYCHLVAINGERLYNEANKLI